MARNVSTGQDRKQEMGDFLWFVFVAAPILIIVGFAWRYWYISLPVLAIGLAWWQRKGRSWWRQRKLDAEARKLNQDRAHAAAVRARADELAQGDR